MKISLLCLKPVWGRIKAIWIGWYCSVIGAFGYNSILIDVTQGLGRFWTVRAAPYYHAVKHLADWVRVHFKGRKTGQQWLAKQKDSLLLDGVDVLIDELKKLPNLSSESRDCRDRLVGYYSRNRTRMQYGTYRILGL